MSTILKIALRNLTQHKVKSLIVGVLITLGITLTFVGNSLFETAAQGVKRGYSENFTGDVMIQGVSDKKFSLFGSEEPSLSGDVDPIPVIQSYPLVLEILRELPSVVAFAGQVSGQVMINLEEKGQSYTRLFGIEPQSYFSTFPSIRILEGRELRNGETGILMSRKRLDQIAKDNKKGLSIGDEVLLTSYSDRGLKIRGVPLVGIYEYAVPTQALEVVSFVDVQTLRALNAMTTGTIAEVGIDSATQAQLEIGVEDFFSDGIQVQTAPPPTRLDLEGLLGDQSVRKNRPTIDQGSWHFLLVRLKPGTDVASVITTLNQFFVEKNLRVKAVNWKDAAGSTAALTDVAQVIFNIVVLILAVVAVIIIINTLVISVMERTGEIGTMRALGAPKAFVRSLFVAETMLLAGVFGLAGIFLGMGTVLGLNLAAPPIDNDFLQVLFGATTLKPNISLSQVVQSFGYALLIGLVSWVYPVSIALKVSPLKAITNE